MKYHNIPSIDLILAYKSGKLTGEELISVERAISLNPMVAGVAESMEVEDVPMTKSIANKIHENFITPKLKHRGFLTKYAGWIGLSSILILLGIYGVTEMLKPEPRYANETMTISDQEVDPNVKVNLETKDQVLIKDENGSTLELSEAGQLVDGSENFEGGKDHNALQNEQLSDNETSNQLNVLGEDKPGDEIKEEDENGFDNTREFSAESKSNRSVLLAVSNVQILSKSNPDALNTRSTGGGGNPLGEQTTSSSNSFSVKDIPSYPGGDRALNNYFRGKLRPIEIPSHQDKFDRTVLIELTINARGKLKDYEIRGQLHPTHQDALIKAIDGLPRFNKGSEKITYSLGLSF